MPGAQIPMLLTAGCSPANTVTIVLQGKTSGASAGVMILDREFHDWLIETGALAAFSDRLALYLSLRRPQDRVRHSDPTHAVTDLWASGSPAPRAD